MNIKKISDYRTLVFDCDGVVLNSNHIKTNAFYKTALPYGEEAAIELVKHHTKNGGISRYKKFEYFLEAIAPKAKGPNLVDLLEHYAREVREGLLTCDIAPGIKELREQTQESRWLIVSGGDQDELRLVFKSRGLEKIFDGGIFGSPNQKEVILDREIASGNIQSDALFIGDSKYDYESAQHAGLDFVFVTGWSEVSDWPPWVKSNKIEHIESIKDLV